MSILEEMYDLLEAKNWKAIVREVLGGLDPEDEDDLEEVKPRLVKALDGLKVSEKELAKHLQKWAGPGSQQWCRITAKFVSLA